MVKSVKLFEVLKTREKFMVKILIYVLKNKVAGAKSVVPRLHSPLVPLPQGRAINLVREPL